MKKIFTMILFAVATIACASAQSKNQKDIAWNDHKKTSNDYDHHSGYYKNNTGAHNDNYFSHKEMQARVARINREFDQKIAAVKSNRHLKGKEKARQIQWLQSQRKNEISKVKFQYERTNQKSYGKTSSHDSPKW
jgi:hypothetical protein